MKVSHLFRRGLPRTFLSVSLLVVLLVAAFAVFTVRSQVRDSESNMSQIIGRTIDESIEKTDLVSIYRIISGFQQAYDGSTVCVRYQSQEVSQIGGADCKDMDFNDFKSHIKGIPYSVAVKVEDPNYLPVSIGLVVLSLVLINLSYLFYLRKIGKKIVTDVDALVGEERITAHTFEEFEEVYLTLRKLRKREIIAAKADAMLLTTQMFAHDVKRPFSLLQKTLKILEQTDFDEFLQLKNKLYRNAEESLAQIQSMITDILELGTPIHLHRREVNLHSMLNQCLDSLREEIEMPSSIEFDVRIPSDLELNLDVEKMNRVFKNLVENAVNAIGESGGVVSIYLKDFNSKSLEVVFHNTNSFISGEEIEAIFQPFYTSRPGFGSGLGMAIAKKFVEAHEGTLSCESNSGSGTSFIIKFKY